MITDTWHDLRYGARILRKRPRFTLVIKLGMLLALVGIAIGVIASLVLGRLLSSLLFGVSSSDPATLVINVLLLCGAALLACFIPARRATRVDPMDALRCG